MKTYTELFDQRGSAYDRAMQQVPQARDQEFAQAIARAQVTAGMVVADVPAGGGYLARHLPAGCRWLGHEPCSSFYAHAGAAGALPTGTSLLPLPWPSASADVALSIAGLHHLEDKKPLFSELARVVKPGGRLVLSDVPAGSVEAAFLDGFVGAHNSTGHEGVFLSAHTLTELQASGCRVLSCDLVPFHWVFASRALMGVFCHGLFDLRRATPEQTACAIQAQLGVDALPTGGVGMRWSLMTVVARNDTTAQGQPT